MNSEKIVVLILLNFVASLIFAQNPITPAGMYIADPEAHVWEDGKLYIYGSRDESDDYWCSHKHHVLSTSDLKSFYVVENAFASKGEYDQVPYSDDLLFAPDCAYKNGVYYLFYCSPLKPLNEGVATSNSPNGPFINGKAIMGAKQIDPAVLVDTDGKTYFYWGQGKPKVSILNNEMDKIDQENIVEPLDDTGNRAFHEGSSIRKIGEKYYFVFADESRGKRPTCLGYAISDKPMGPFAYKGIIIDNNGCDPAVWNNHGSIEKFNDQWYVFYHRSTNNSRKFRKACIEPITINEDGTIDEVEMTSQGAGAPIKAHAIIEAEWACGLSGNVRICELPSLDITSEGLSEIKNNDTAVFKYINFDHDYLNGEVKIVGGHGGLIEFRLDNANGKKIGECILGESNTNAFTISTFSVKKNKGIHALYLVFKGEQLPQIDWFRFY